VTRQAMRRVPCVLLSGEREGSIATGRPAWSIFSLLSIGLALRHSSGINTCLWYQNGAETDQAGGSTAC